MESVQTEVTKKLLEINTIKIQPSNPFTWASGWKSPIYCDNRTTLSFPKIRNYLRENLANLIEQEYGKPDVIAGVATGAIAIGVLVAQHLNVPFVYVRPEPKSHGRKNQVEGLLEKNKKGRWEISHSPLYLEFLQGRRDYECTPWGNPNYSVLGWQKPCYLLDDGYAESFKELMDTTKWESYGHNNNKKCADCTAHCGYEATAVKDATANLKNMLVSARLAIQ